MGKKINELTPDSEYLPCFSLEKPPKEKLILYAVFCDIANLKQIFEFLKECVEDTCPVTFTESTISFTHVKQKENEPAPSFVSNIVIDICELVEYKLVTKYCNLEQHVESTTCCSNCKYTQKNIKTEPQFGFNISVSDFSSLLKSTLVHDKLKIELYEGESFLRCVLIGTTPTNKNIQINKYEEKKYAFQNNEIKTCNNSFVRIGCEEFAAKCASLTKSAKGSLNTHLHVYDNGLILSSDQSLHENNVWGNCSNYKYHFLIFPDTIKILGKIKKFHQKGIIRLFAVDNRTIRIDTSLSIGCATIYIGNSMRPE